MPDDIQIRFLNPKQAEAPCLGALRAGANLQGAIDRPRRLAHYEGEDRLARLGAALLWAITRQHGLIDGNKRASLGITEEFLALNDCRFVDDEDSLFDLAMAAAEQSIDEAEVEQALGALIETGEPTLPLPERMPQLMHRLATA